jgi:hypothetical protein
MISGLQNRLICFLENSSKMSKGSRKYLLIAIHNKSWGRTEMAIRVAKKMITGGMQVMLLIHQSLQPLLVGSRIANESIADHLGGFAKLIIDRCVQKNKPHSIIFFDYLNTVNYLFQIGIKDSSFLLKYNSRIITLDTWDFNRTGVSIDLLGGIVDSLVKGDPTQKIAEFNSITYRMIPVPIANVNAETSKFNCL